MTLRNWLWSRPAKATPKPAPRVRLGVQTLEDLSVPAADFLSALSVGNNTGDSSALDVIADAAGNSYVTGSFSGTVDFDPVNDHLGGADVMTARGTLDAFVAKYAPDGGLTWVRQMGGDAADGGRKVALDGGGNVLMVGDFQGEADFGPVTRTSAGGKDGFVAKLGRDGTVQWANPWGVASRDNGTGVGADAAGNVYATGSRFGGTAATNGVDVLKFSPTGAVAAGWPRWVNTRQSQSSADLAVDAAGNAFVSGLFAGTVDFDPGTSTRSLSSGGTYSGFVLKLGATGSYGWASAFQGQTIGSYSNTSTLALDGSGGVVVGGFYGGSVDFKPGSGTYTLPTVGGGFVAKLNSQGAFVWAKALEKDGNGESVFVRELAVDAGGSIYATGSFSGTADFNPSAATYTRTSNGQDDAFVLKLTSTGNLGWAETFGGAATDYGLGIAVDPTGTIHLTGQYQGTVDFDPDPAVAFDLTNPGTYRNMFLVRLGQN